MRKISENLTLVREQISEQALKAGRSPDTITLLAVSKKKPAADVRAAHAAGQQHFGENYLQEALDKQAELKELDLCWHFIGPLQSNKTKAVAEAFSWVHSVDRLKIAQRLSDQRPQHLPPLNICIQVNIDHQTSKSGCEPAELDQLVAAITALKQIKLRGLMCIPSPTNSDSAFAQMQSQLARINSQFGLNLDTLSMGMSGDMDKAIAHGATIVRVGTAIFGQRD